MLDVCDLSGEDGGVRGGENMSINTIPCNVRARIHKVNLIRARCPVTGTRDYYICNMAYSTDGKYAPEYASLRNTIKKWKDDRISGEALAGNIRTLLMSVGCTYVTVKLYLLNQAGIYHSIETI